MNMNRKEVRAIAESIESALQGVAKQYGVQIKTGSGKFWTNNLTLKLEISKIGEDGKAQTKEAEDFKMMASRYGLKQSDLNREFKDFSGTHYRIVGAAPRSRKYPILVENIQNGKIYKFPRQRVLAALASS